MYVDRVRSAKYSHQFVYFVLYRMVASPSLLLIISLIYSSNFQILSAEGKKGNMLL